MRILGGTATGRKLVTIKARGIRRTRDDVKESIFIMIQGHVETAVVLDLFAGTGTLGLEALNHVLALVCAMAAQPFLLR